MTQTLRLERPPVRGVTLTVFFAQIAALQISHLTALREEWRGEYPAVAEQAPRGLRYPEVEVDEVLVIDDPWLYFPYLTLSTLSGDRQIGIQQDRFTVAWQFDEPADQPRTSYPGFSELRNELERKLVQFAEHVKRELNETLQLKAAECRYRNVVTSLSGAALQLGIATGWLADSPSEQLLSADWFGFRLHYCRTPQNYNCSTFITVETEAGEHPTLAIWVDREVPEDAHDEEISQLAGLDHAHAESLKHFIACSNPDLRKQWGGEVHENYR